MDSYKFWGEVEKGLWDHKTIDDDCKQLLSLAEIIENIPTGVSIEDCAVIYDDMGLALYWRKKVRGEIYKDES